MTQCSTQRNAAWLVRLATTFGMLLVAFALLAPNVASAVALVDTIVVKYRDDSSQQSAAAVAAADRLALGHLLKASFTDAGRTRDGAFRLAISPPLPIDVVRSAMNKVRFNPDVLYANVAERRSVPKSVAVASSTSMQRPVRSLIVKYRGTALTPYADTDRFVPRALLQRVADVAGMPVAQARTMSGGEYLLQFFKPMSAIAAFNISESLEADPDVEYADPDLWKSPTLTPNDTCYGINTNPVCFNSTYSYYMHEWHLMPGGIEAGGANLPPAWDITTGSPTVYIGVIDTGILANHPDLVGRTGVGYDFIYDFALANDSQPVQTASCLQGGNPLLFDPLSPPCVSSRDSDPSDPGDWIDAADQSGNMNSWFFGCGAPSASSWHGSHTAGTIGAASNNAAGIAGINWVSPIVPLRVLGKCGGYTSDVIDAIKWGSGDTTVPGAPVNANVAKVLNLSLGGGGPCLASEQAAINAALGRGTVVVISAGNTNTNAINNSPGNCNGSITVAATQRQGIKAQYSAFGTSVEIAAPGGGRNFPETPSIIRNLVISTVSTGATVPSSYAYAGFNGTSMAAPHVAGVASLMLSVNPALTPAQVLSIIQTTARPFPVVGGATCPASTSCNCTTSLCGAGLLDAGAAVAMAVPPAVSALPVYRFNAAGVYHFYTMSEVEKNYVLANFPTWTLEGVGYYAYPTQVASTLPVYRFNAAGGYHFYTIFESEKNAIIANLPTWTFEGIGFYSFPTATSGTYPVYRFNTGITHFYTASEVEKNYVLANFPTWTLEGVGYYARNAP